jgi:poly(hydroxyalkanoate) depolymerase family esterase
MSHLVQCITTWCKLTNYPAVERCGTMDLKIPSGLLYATRLVRAGRLGEATAAIQRALSGDGPDGHRAAAAAGGSVIEGVARVIDVDADPTPLKQAANSDRFSATAPAPAEETGQFVAGTYTNHAGTREYKTYIPALYHGQPLPLLVMLHGCKQDPDDFALGTRMNALADEHGFVVVYPKQAREANVSHCWNWFQAKDQQRGEGEPSLIAGITRAVMDTYHLDRRRVYVAGLSAGGAMAAIMATTYPDVYAAAGIHSGLAYAAAGDLPSAVAAMRGETSKRSRHKRRDAFHRKVPTIVFHGDRDKTVHPNNGDQVIAHASSPRSNVRPDASAEGESTVETGWMSGRTYTRKIYQDRSRRSIVEQWIVHGAGHAWSGGSANGSFSDPKGPDASREMLRFFLQHEITEEERSRWSEQSGAE